MLFTDPNIEYPINNPELSFTDYITACKTLIAKHRLDLNSPKAERIINANAPFELRPQQAAKCGALLIHGLLDSPFTMQEIGLQLQAQGLLTRAILLPGHGTVPGALLKTDYHQWLQTVQYGISTFANEVDTLFLVGYSTGASLALYHTLQNSSNIAGIILLSPAIQIASVFAGIANGYKTLSWAWPRAAWLHQDPNEMLDYAKYLSLPFNAVYQVYRLTQQIKKTKTSQVPLLFALSKNDNTVCSRASIRYFKQQLHPKNHLLLYSNEPNLCVDPRITQRHASYPLLRIRDFSHLTLPFSPQNPHYGQRGDYALASHVPTEDQTLYGEFTPFQIQCNEWLYKLKLSQHHYQRLTFNPDFKFLIKTIEEFIKHQKI